MTLVFFYFRSLFAFSVVDNGLCSMYQHKCPVRIYKPEIRSTILNSFADLHTPRRNAQCYHVDTLTVSLTKVWFVQILAGGVTARQFNQYSERATGWTSDETINPVHAVPPISLSFILILSPFTLKPLQSSLPARHSDQHFVCHYHLPHACYTPCLISPSVMTTVTKQELCTNSSMSDGNVKKTDTENK